MISQLRPAHIDIWLQVRNIIIYGVKRLPLTIHYKILFVFTLASEVIRHERYDYAADVYSFGILMWEMISREKPFDAKSPIEAAGAVALEGKRPPFPEGIPSNVRTLLEGCWADKSMERISVEQIIESIGEISQDMIAESWLAAPTGHPVYKKVAVDDTTRKIENTPTKQKKKTLMKGMFRKKSM